MILDTTILDINGTILVRIPPAMVEHFRIKDNPRPQSCKIEDLPDKEIRIIL